MPMAAPGMALPTNLPETAVPVAQQARYDLCFAVTGQGKKTWIYLTDLPIKSK
jgi:hypothetical protein